MEKTLAQKFARTSLKMFGDEGSFTIDVSHLDSEEAAEAFRELGCEVKFDEVKPFLIVRRVDPERTATP
ncbi:MAG: hypothetical protein EON58_01075 [Alphaproteobacteria bacterium]|nr:MAG: hypothetical protein EON58_01075 [Alphaproteobacteria bacterium]